MRIAFVGNQGNNAYRLVKWLRELGIDARLFLLQDAGERSDPRSIDRELDVRTCDWVESLVGASEERIRSLEADARAIVTSGFHGLMFVARLQPSTFVTHMSLGSEVTELPRMHLADDCEPRMRPHSVAAEANLRRADQIVTGFRPTMRTLSQLGLLFKTRVCGYPEDVRGNARRVDRSMLEELDRRFAGHHRVFLWLSRVNYLRRELSDYKGPEKFLEAFRDVVRSGADVVAVIGEHGRDIEAFKELIASWDLTHAVTFVPHMPYWQLLTYLSIRNAVVVDELDPDKGELSGMAREALSVGGVCIKTLDADLIGLCHGEGCPVLSATDVDSCRRRMEEVCAMSQSDFLALRERGREWAMRPLHYDDKALRYVGIVEHGRYLHALGRESG